MNTVSRLPIKVRLIASMNGVLMVIAALALLLTAESLAAPMGARLKDIAAVKGVRENVLIGYGLVVGLKGTGDSSTEVTARSLGRLFGKLGLDVDKGATVKSKNAAAVIVTAKLPAFARTGNKIDITVSSIGDSSTLEGGTLLVTPLRAGDQQVYAVAQGQITLGGVADGSTKNFPTVARVVNGAMIERDVETNFSSKKSFRLSLNDPDFTTSARLVTLINAELGGKFASARDSATIDLVVPFNYEGSPVEFLSRIENLRVVVDQRAKVVLNERTGTVVMGDKVMILPVAISHGDLSLAVSGGAKGKGDRVVDLKPAGASVSDLVKILNTMGVSPKDLTAIFQTLKQTGALQADLELL